MDRRYAYDTRPTSSSQYQYKQYNDRLESIRTGLQQEVQARSTSSQPVQPFPRPELQQPRTREEYEKMLMLRTVVAEGYETVRFSITVTILSPTVTLP